MKKNIKNKNGISLIVLVITIIVIIILAAAVILTISNNNPVEKANEASLKNDIQTMKEELSLKVSDKILNKESISTLDGAAEDAELTTAAKYPGVFKISNGKLQIDNDVATDEQKLVAKDLGIEECWDNSKAYLFDIDENGVLKGIKSDYKENNKIYSDTSKANEIKELIIPNTVKTIGTKAFYACSGLTSVTIPSSVTDIEGSAFVYCSGLTNMVIPDSVKTMGYLAIGYCSGLKSITLSKNLKEITNETFKYCSGLTSIDIPSGVETMGELVFNGCSSLTSVTIPSSVKNVVAYTFSAVSLSNIKVGNDDVKNLLMTKCSISEDKITVDPSIN